MASSACLSSATVIKRLPQTQHAQLPPAKPEFSIADLSQPWITSSKIFVRLYQSATTANNNNLTIQEEKGAGSSLEYVSTRADR